ncbi:MAG: Outer membrane lipoprotein carrier protein LolA [Rhodanobacteraceae bacterium]|jgi:outer membrane lipoprotein carrier protein|nr:MAG: Outer membrane lipoprotein carrier protein LolA [Rhodanobacteraceae bacterium]
MRKLILLAALSLFACATFAATGARARLDAFASGLHSLRGDFTQTVYDSHGNITGASHGLLALQAPRLFRWEVTDPYQQLIVADGKKVWVYEPDLQQVTVRDQGATEAHSPLTVLTDLSQLDSEFKTTDAGTRDGLEWLRLVSRAKGPQFEYAEIGFDATGPRRMVFKDTLGNRTEIAFSGWQRNPSLPADTFTFVPPKGTDVVGDAATAAPASRLKH